ELQLADAQVLLRLADGDLGGGERLQRLRRRLAGAAQRLLERPQLGLERDAVLVGGQPRRRDPRLAPRVGAEIPAKADEPRADRLRLEDRRAGVVHLPARLE